MLVVIRKTKDGDYIAKVVAFPDFWGYGETVEEAKADILNSAKYYFECESVAPEAFEFVVEGEAPPSPPAEQEGMTIDGVKFSAEDVRQLTELGEKIMAAF